MKRMIFLSSTLMLAFFLGISQVQAQNTIEKDSDNDGLSDRMEAIYYIDPLNPDTDGDGYPDGLEVATGYSPRVGNGARIGHVDYDDDRVNDWVEQWFSSDMGNTDSDDDGMSDFEEIMRGYSPIAGENIQIFPRHIEVDKTRQYMYFVVDRMKILEIPVSTGNPWTETPSGEFSVMKKIPLKNYVGADYFIRDVPWNIYFAQGGYYIHGSWWHSSYGRRTESHGCVNVSVPDMKELYQYADDDMHIHIYGETPPRRVVGL